MKLKNKIFITFLFLLTFILFFNINNVFAYSNISNTGLEYTFPDELVNIIKSSEYYNDNYYVMGFKSTHHGNYYINFIEKTDTLKITFNNQNDFKANEYVNYYSSSYKISDLSVNVPLTYLKNKNYNAQSLFGKTCDANIFYLDNGTYYNSSGDVFFQPTPTETEKTKTLAEIMKTAGEQATAEVGQIILIVIMITAGLTVLLIGLKKGLTVLMNGFRH